MLCISVAPITIQCSRTTYVLCIAASILRGIENSRKWKTYFNFSIVFLRKVVNTYFYLLLVKLKSILFCKPISNKW